MKRAIALFGFFVFISSFAYSQTILDGAYIKEHVRTKRVVPYPPIRESDVLWSKRIWRTIDLKEKLNFSLYYPIEPIKGRLSLFDVIKQSLLVDGSLTAYSPGPLLQDDEFTTPLSPEEIKNIFFKSDTSMAENIDTGEFEEVIQDIELGSTEITQYRLKEIWYFDKQTSTIQVRIIGIAPMKEVFSEEGIFQGYQPVFWLYFPECRYVFVNYESFNPKNDAQRISFDDLLNKRIFSSIIIKEENVYDRMINSYASGVDALLESERIKKEIFNWEHDLWSY
jgi:gliding motility associated protien GldN